MPLHPPIPPLLSQTVSNLPFGSLALLTSTLGATTNWLLLRFVHAVLKNSDHDEPFISGATQIVLVSWLRDAHFWKDGARKLGSNLQKMHIIDALGNGLGLSAGGIAEVETEILKTNESAKKATRDEGRVLLVLDGLDFLLAATACPVLDITKMLGELREVLFCPLNQSFAAFWLIRSSITSTYIPLS